MDPPAEMRKARPPRSVSPVMGQPDQRIRCVALYEPGNGEPLGAVLVPVQLRGATWLLLVANGEPIDTPAPGDIRATPCPAPLAPDSPDAAVTIDLPWPDSASHALLLLFHAQLAGLGDPAQLLQERSLITGIVPLHLLALQISDALSQAALPQAALPQATRVGPGTDAQQMVRRAVAVYLNEPDRDGSGILAMPQFPDAQASPTQRRGATQPIPPPTDGGQAACASHTG
ncbi:MAG: hypothetical protein ABIR55_08110, partial [Burkholderiaceae bacterium]